MANVIVIMILAVVIGYACFHIYKTKKQGGCVGCSCSGTSACTCKKSCQTNGNSGEI